MNFYERQAEVRRLSRRLVVYFVLAVLSVIAAVDVVLLVFVGGSDATTADQVTLVVVGSAVTLGVIGTVSLTRSAQLRSGGGGAVARELGGVRVDPSTTELNHRRLVNVVEEICIASGMPAPEVYVLEGEPAINAFAAGHSPADAAVAVTSGALESLNRLELEGVIAHEISHVANGDMRLNIRLIGALYGIQVLAILGRGVLRGGVYSRAMRVPRGGRSGKGSGGGGYIVLIGLAAMVIGYVGVLMGRIIKAAVSRQREYLADASAVEFTRHTDGLVGALKKIGGLTGSELRHGKVDDVSHMLFGNGLRLSAMFATHPPLTERIRALDPAIDAAQLEAQARRWETDPPPSGLAEDEVLGLAGPSQSLPAADARLAVQPAAVAASAANPTEATYQQAGTILASLPPGLRARAHDPATALPLVLGLLLADDPTARTQQHRVIVDQLGPAVADAAWQHGSELHTLHPALRLPLSEIAFPALRRGDTRQLEAILVTVHALIWVDGEVSVHEYCLASLLYRDLNEALGHDEPASARRHTLARSPAEAATLLAVLAAAGHPDPNAARQAYETGLATLPLGPSGQVATSHPYRPPVEGVRALDRVWTALDRLDWNEKSRLMEGMMTVASHDGVVSIAEMELVRMVCSMLHCPLPPQLPALTPDDSGAAGAPAPDATNSQG